MEGEGQALSAKQAPIPSGSGADMNSIQKHVFDGP